MKTEELLEERGSRYGSFDSQARIVQALKTTMMEGKNWDKLRPYQKEALEMIQHKIGRMLNGDPMYEDNVEDILGYAKLMLDQMKIDNELVKQPKLPGMEV